MFSSEDACLPGQIIGLRSERRRQASAKRLLRGALPAALLSVLAPAALAQDTKPAVPPIEQRVEAFVTQLEAKRKELDVPGASVVVVQGGRIVRIAGLGQRSLEPPEPVTADTVFQIASVTKQFTAMAVALAVSEGKLSFEDHPRRFIPTFRLKDPEADARLNLIDLLAHRSGLDRSDFTFLLAPFTQEEMFSLAGRATPAAKFRERFLYNNTMVALAGAVVGRAYDTTYERFMAERILKPLGMNSTTVTFAAFMADPKRAIGYSGLTGTLKPEKPADLSGVPGAGAINSTARDMGAWLRFLNAHGQREGALKISPAAYARLFEPHQKFGSESVGLGFFLATRSGVLIASHGGNLPGVSSHVVHVPERALSFALLTNLSASSLPAAAQELFWETVVQPELPAAAPPATPSKPAPPPQAAAAPIAPDLLPGSYYTVGGDGFELRKTDSGLAAVFAGQPPYPLKASGTNVYELAGLIGFSLTFAESPAMPGRITVRLRQPPSHPGGNITYLKKDIAWLERAKAQYTGPGADLIGFYHSQDRTALMEIAPVGQGLALILTVQAPLPLVHFGGDLYRFEGEAETFRLTVKRAAGNRIAGFLYEQPNVRVEMVGESSAGVDTGPEASKILDAAVAAAGGVELLDRLVSTTRIGRANAPTHGVDGRWEERIVVGKRVRVLELGAFGKFMIRGRSFTNERESVTVSETAERTPATGKAVEAARFFAVPHPLYRWKERFPKVAIAGETAVNGETAHIIELTPAGLAPARLYISAKSALILREEVPSYLGDALQTAEGTDWWDYRIVHGVRVPFAAAVTSPGLGRIELTFDRVLLDAPIDQKVFE